MMENNVHVCLVVSFTYICSMDGSVTV